MLIPKECEVEYKKTVNTIYHELELFSLLFNFLIIYLK